MLFMGLTCGAVVATPGRIIERVRNAHATHQDTLTYARMPPPHPYTPTHHPTHPHTHTHIHKHTYLYIRTHTFTSNHTHPPHPIVMLLAGLTCGAVVATP